MKTTIPVLLVLLFSFQSFPQTNSFVIGFSGMYPHRYDYQLSKNIDWNWYNELNINTWEGWYIGDQEKEVVDTLDRHGFWGYFQPDTLRWLAFGKVLVHEAESTLAGGSSVARFRYFNHHHEGTAITDVWQGQTQRVQYYEALPTSPENPILVLSDVKENGVHSFSGINNDPIYECGFPGRNPNQYYYIDQWYIKPRMRISVNDAFGPERSVVKIVVNSFDGTELASVILTTLDFRIGNINNYNGAYIEDYFFRNMSVDANLYSGINRGRENISWLDFTHLPDCHIDYQIYWYGDVSVWIDYVKVMDQPAENLLGSGPDSRYFRERIRAKVQALLDEDTGNRMKGFYTEEIEYSNLTCFKMLQDSLQAWFPQQSAKVKIVPLIDDYSYVRNLRERHRNEDYAYYVQMVRPPVFLFTEYLFWYNDSPVDNYIRAYLPNVPLSFPTNYPQVIRQQVSEAYPTIMKTYNEYTDRLQLIFDRCVDSIRNYKVICMANGIDFHFVPNITAIAYYGQQNLREKMNSEMSAEQCLALCYGAKGIMPYAWDSYYKPELPEYQIAEGDIDDIHPYSIRKRELNFYGENKWQFTAEHFRKLRIWGPVFMASNNTQGYSVSREGANHNYILDIRSIYRDPLDLSFRNDDAVKYWEMGFFAAAAPQNDYSKYFMFVNRRCVPETSPGIGDIRQLKIKFDANQLTYFNNWKLIDLNTGNSVTFDKNNQGQGGYVDLGSVPGSLGYFVPGEGKLYRLAPVMQVGGELVADEYVSGITFDCDGVVYNGGKNITFDLGTTINFADTAKIVMNGGSFMAGSYTPQDGPRNIHFHSSNALWEGLEFNNCDRVNISNSVFENIKPVTTFDSVNYAVKMVDCFVYNISNNTFINQVGRVQVQLIRRFFSIHLLLPL